MSELRRKLADLRRQWEMEKSGLGDVHQIRSKLADVELQFNHLSAAIKEKQSSGVPVDEADYQKLYELDLQRKQLSEQLETARARASPAAAAGGCCARRSARRKSPRSSAPGPASR